MTARDQVSAVGEKTCSGFGDLARDRDRLFLAGFGFAISSFSPSADFAAERDPRLRAGVAWEP
jgi:hypothetical protein